MTGAGEFGKAANIEQAHHKFSFTGSPGVGRLIGQAAAASMEPVTMEMGGKSPNIVFDDADFDRALIGGMKDFGFGRVRGEAGIREFMQTKNVFIDFSGDKRDPFSTKY